MQRILDLLLNEVKVSVITREKNRPDLQAKHGRYRASAGTPGRVAYERDRVGVPSIANEPTGDYKTYAHYAASRTPDVKRDGARLSAPDARKVINRQSALFKAKTGATSDKQKMPGGKPVSKVQASNIMNRRRADLMRRGAGKGPVMTSKGVNNLPEGMNCYERLTTLLLGEQQKSSRPDRTHMARQDVRTTKTHGERADVSDLKTPGLATQLFGKKFTDKILNRKLKKS